MTIYDPPGGWRHGFPRVYKPEPGETLEDTLVRDGYPEKEAGIGAKHCRFSGREVRTMTLFGGRIPNEDGDGYNLSPKQYNEPLMIPGYGAQPVPAEKYNPTNDNVAQSAGPLNEGEGLPKHMLHVPMPPVSKPRQPAPANDNFIADESGASAGFAVGGYIGLARRAGDFMQTYCGGKYWPCDPRPEEVFIEDIAHSLSLQCRYAGHCREFYSVAEHSVHIARWLQRKYGPVMALHGLLHDATEAYVVDVPRPLKPFLANYKDIENKNWLAIASRFGLARELPAEVHEADNRIIADELVNLAPMEWHARYNEPLGVRIGCWSPGVAEEEFLITFEALTNRRAAA